jgi:hypothetical protein
MITEVKVGGVSGESGANFSRSKRRGVNREGGHNSGIRYLFSEVAGMTADSEGSGVSGEEGHNSGSGYLVSKAANIVADSV